MTEGQAAGTPKTTLKSQAEKKEWKKELISWNPFMSLVSSATGSSAGDIPGMDILSEGRMTELEDTNQKSHVLHGQDSQQAQVLGPLTPKMNGTKVLTHIKRGGKNKELRTCPIK